MRKRGRRQLCVRIACGNSRCSRTGVTMQSAPMSSATNGDESMDVEPDVSPPRTPPVGNGAQASATTWNFVQMNMTLLPIARPLPVTICHRFQDGVNQTERKPITPTQKLQRRILEKANNISPRRHELSIAARRRLQQQQCHHSTDFLAASGAANDNLSISTKSSYPYAHFRQTDKPDAGCKRKRTATFDAPTPIYTGPMVYSHDEDKRVRSSSAEVHASQFAGLTLSRGSHASYSPLHGRPLFKGKRILELQDEERRLLPDERATGPSPTKRSRMI